MDRDELQEQTKRFARRVIKLVEALPNTVAGGAIGQQVIRSATSVASKLSVVTEEADETAFRLEMVIESNQLQQTR